MKLVILGGGGFRVPLVFGAVLDWAEAIATVVLHDVDAARLATMNQVLTRQAELHGGPAPQVTCTTDLAEAVTGADFIFSAFRVGGTDGRCRDEHVALSRAVLGQETTGPGGLAYGLRTVPIALDVARTIAQCAPQAWTINFTNPAGLITQAMQTVLGSRVVGICDSPIGLGRRAARALGLNPEQTQFGYSGLNHLGWLNALYYQGRDVLPDLLADPQRLLTTEEGRLFGPDLLADLGAIPNEYLYYYYFNRDAVAAISAATETRGEYLHRTQGEFYAAAADDIDPYEVWQRTRLARDESYMAETRGDGEERDAEDVVGGGYERVAVAMMAAISSGERASMILNVTNRSTLAGLPETAVVEVPCVVDSSGPRPCTTDQLTGHQLGLVATVKEAEELIIEAVTQRNAAAARKAFAIHPLVDSVTVANDLLAGYRREFCEIDEIL